MPSGCIEWTGARQTGGYGQTVAVGFAGKPLAHRLAFFLATGIAPGEKVVCHTCDNRACINPDHLWLGTLTDNNRDMRDKGRVGKRFSTRANDELRDAAAAWAAERLNNPCPVNAAERRLLIAIHDVAQLV